MYYQKVKFMDLSEITRRLRDGQNISQIAAQTGRDRKTVRKYINEIKEISDDLSAVTDKTLYTIAEQNKKNKEKQKLYEPYLTEIKEHLQDEHNPLKIKSLYEVITVKHGLSEAGSLSSFKRFLKDNNLRSQQKITCRMEREPAGEIQIDYGKAGKLLDPVTGKSRTVYMFIGTLPSSRHKYAEFVFKQDQKSFVQSHVKMFNYYAGVPKVLTIDNLKTGVIKADLYDPTINRTYLEMAEHYKCFVNPCRIIKPKDKPTVERDMQTIREEFRKMLAINPLITLTEANSKILAWLINDYGQRPHGTTKQKPYEVFKTIEHPLMSPLPESDYEITEWKEAKVHPDCFIQVNKKSYSVPYQYVGKILTVNVKRKIVDIYYNAELIKTHYIPKNNRQTDYDDFPENIQMAISDRLPAYLLKEAERISGENLRELIERLLTPHVFVNLRRAQGILAVAKKYDSKVTEQASYISLTELTSHHPKQFKSIILHLLTNQTDTSRMTISDMTAQFMRPANYFINNNG